MSTALKHGEPAMRGARRVLLHHVDAAIHILQRRSLGDEPVHEARKEMKRARAGCRLLCNALGETAYQRLNRSVRDAARPLTPIRDSKVLHEALDDLLQEASESAQESDVSQVRRALRQEHASSRDKLSNKEIAASRARLQEVKQRLQEVPDFRLDHASVDAALGRAYKKAHKAFAAAQREPSNEHLHEWRKQVKYHFHQLELVQPLKPNRIDATIKQAHKLADHLGDDHDLALLQQKIVLHATQAPASSAAVATDALIDEIKRRRAKLQRKSYRLGKKLYADKPKRVAKRMGKYVEAWQRAA